MSPSTPRRLALAFAAALVTVVAYRWAARDDASTVSSARRAATVTATAGGAPVVTTARPPAVETSPRATPRVAVSGTSQANASPASAATSRPFDLATLPHERRARHVPTDEERFPTTEWFTREDQRHPERYFELAARMPELNRPEERRATLRYFEAYREKLERDRDASTDAAAREEIAATLERYDAAIGRLHALIDAEQPR